MNIGIDDFFKDGFFFLNFGSIGGIIPESFHAFDAFYFFEAVLFLFNFKATSAEDRAFLCNFLYRVFSH